MFENLIVLTSPDFYNYSHKALGDEFINYGGLLLFYVNSETGFLTKIIEE